MTRNEIAIELMRDCPEESRADHSAIALAILTKEPWDDVLAMAEEWPETYRWLKDNRPA